MPKPSSSFYASSGFVSLFSYFFFLLFRARVYTRSKTHKSTQTRREEDSEPCFLSRVFARLQRRDDLPPASATTSGVADVGPRSA